MIFLFMPFYILQSIFFYVATLRIILLSFFYVSNNNFNYKKCRKMSKDTIIGDFYNFLKLKIYSYPLNNLQSTLW